MKIAVLIPLLKNRTDPIGQPTEPYITKIINCDYFLHFNIETSTPLITMYNGKKSERGHDNEIGSFNLNKIIGYEIIK